MCCFKLLFVVIYYIAIDKQCIPINHNFMVHFVTSCFSMIWLDLKMHIVVQSRRLDWVFTTPWTATCWSSLSFTISWGLLKFMSIESVMPSNYLIFWHPFLLLPSIFAKIRVFSNELAVCTKWPMYWSFSFSISPSNEYSGLISFKTDWFDLLAVQGALKSLLQYHSLKASLLWYSAFFMVQLSQMYVTTEKTIALTIWTFVS